MSSGCATTGIALRSETIGYLATDQKVDAFFPNDKSEMTRCSVVLPAGSMVKTSGTKFKIDDENAEVIK
jgi:hypothetical protein